MLYDFTVGLVHLLQQVVVVPRRKYVFKHRLSEQLLGSVPVRYREWPSSIFHEAERPVGSSLSRQHWSGSEGAATSLCTFLLDDDCLNDDDDRDLGNVLTSGTPDPCFVSKA